MKKVFSLLAVLAVTVFMASSVWAALPSAQKAYASFAAEALEVNFDLYLHQNGKQYTFGTGGNYTTTVSSITFDLSSVTVGTTTASFAQGQVFARVTSNLIRQKAGTNIYMFTKNTEATTFKANYNDNTKFTGLIRDGNTATYVDGDNAPLEMHFVKLGEAPTSYFSTWSDDGKAYGDKYLTDKAAGDFGDGEYAIIGTTGASGGIWIGYGEDASHYSIDSDVIVFFRASFKNVSAGDEYGTECIVLQTTTE